MNLQQSQAVGRFLALLPSGSDCPVCHHTSPHALLKEGMAGWSVLGITEPSILKDGVTARRVEMRCEVCYFVFSFDAERMGVPLD